ncbi:nicotinate-nucleotide--dimethylbenzimidazole phosphoribosyltransferase [Paenibacillus sp. strain BS8-2]
MDKMDREQLLMERIAAIPAFDTQAAEQAQQHSNQLTKPPGSLGKLEEMAATLAGINGGLWPDLSRRAVIVMAGDHGVCEEGVSAFPAAVTPQMVINFLNGGAAVNVLSRQANAEVVCVDIGVAAELSHPELISRKVVYGTNNMARGAAMSREEALQAIWTGIDIVDEKVRQGLRMFATGEMGIGNTTASAAIASVLGGLAPDTMVGRGTGIGDVVLAHKIEVVRKAIAINDPRPDDPLDVLAKVGGAEIAGLVGVIIGAAANRCPVVIDGFISSAAALIASRLAPASLQYMLASHLSHEHAHGALLHVIGLSPLIHLEMRLGEGTGAVLCFHLIDAALNLMQEMATFDSAGVSQG